MLTASKVNHNYIQIHRNMNKCSWKHSGNCYIIMMYSVLFILSPNSVNNFDLMFLPMPEVPPEMWVSAGVYACPNVLRYLLLQSYWDMQLHTQQVIDVRVGVPLLYQNVKSRYNFTDNLFYSPVPFRELNTSPTPSVSSNRHWICWRRVWELHWLWFMNISSHSHLLGSADKFSCHLTTISTNSVCHS
jgi:hypothetical protein